MAVALGKKRRQTEEDASTSSSDDEATARALFQRAFEARFKPLNKAALPLQQTEEKPSETVAIDDQDDWDGLSGDDEKVEVVQVQSFSPAADLVSAARERKAFMSGRIPLPTNLAKVVKTKQNQDADGAEVANLKNDVALQRLLKESHLLDASTYSSTGTEVQGKSRLKALDLRIQDLGGKTSHLSQQKMPLNHRRGIETKATDREHKRRKEAADNGIILERAKFASKSAKPREKGIGGPSVGKFRGGMLKLSGKDLQSIQSSGPGGRRGHSVRRGK